MAVVRQRLSATNLTTRWLPAIVFLSVAACTVAFTAFPALYGDEYDSVFDAGHLFGNVHAFGYFFQLHLWSRLFHSDLSLRSLSLVWDGLAALWFHRWLESERLPEPVRWFASLVLVVNPFFWQYAFQIRFYSYFLATSLLVFWRCTELRRSPKRRNLAWLLLAFLLVATSHLFGWLVVGLAVLYLLYFRRPRFTLAMIVTGLLGLGTLMVWPAALQAVIALVYRVSNPYADVPLAVARGLSVAMLAKLPLTLYFFALGERVYPLWWWLTVPFTGIIAWCGFQGLRRLRSYPGLMLWAGLGSLSLALLYLVFDPLAPPTLQGATPRYVIFVLPVFLAVVALGAAQNRAGRLLLVGGQVAALGIFLFPSWSNNGDLIDWPTYLRTTITQPEKTCLVIDGRGRGPVERYAPNGVRIASDLDTCRGYDRVLLISSDYRLPMVRHFDGWASSLAAQGYGLVTNIVQFPAQITVYQRGANSDSQVPPARLGLPEQDMRLPMPASGLDRQLQGFVRLDSETPSYRGPVVLPAAGDVYLVSNYRATEPIVQGTPVFSVVWLGADGQRAEVILRAGSETAAWNGACETCVRVATWPKRLHLVGAQAYPGAYRHYRAAIWEAKIPLPAWPVQEIEVTSLLAEGTVYFWGLYPSPNRRPTP